MTKMLASVLICSVICSVTLAEPVVHAIRIRFPGPNDKIVLPVKQKIAPYPPAGFKPQPEFELPESTYLPPADPELNYGAPAEEYGPPAKPELDYEPPETKLTYGPPSDTYGPPDLTYGAPDNTYAPPEIDEFQSATIVNAPLTHITQFIPPRPNKAVNFRPLRPQAAAIVNAPLRPLSHLILPRPQRIMAFRPKRPSVQSQKAYPKTYLTLPRVERLIEFRPRRIPSQQQFNFFNRPLPSSIFGNSNKSRADRQLPSKIFSN